MARHVLGQGDSRRPVVSRAAWRGHSSSAMGRSEAALPATAVAAAARGRTTLGCRTPARGSSGQLGILVASNVLSGGRGWGRSGRRGPRGLLFSGAGQDAARLGPCASVIDWLWPYDPSVRILLSALSTKSAPSFARSGTQGSGTVGRGWSTAGEARRIHEATLRGTPCEDELGEVLAHLALDIPREASATVVQREVIPGVGRVELALDQRSGEQLPRHRGEVLGCTGTITCRATRALTVRGPCERAVEQREQVALITDRAARAGCPRARDPRRSTVVPGERAWTDDVRCSMPLGRAVAIWGPERHRRRSGWTPSEGQVQP